MKDEHAPDADAERMEHLALLSQQGYQYLKEDMIDQARESFEAILAEDPTNNYALVGLGDLCRKEERYDQAVRYYQTCLNAHPENSYALFGLAESYRSQRRYNHALEVWERYLVHDSQNVTVLTRVADAYRKVRKFERSRELYQQVLDIEPDNAYALIGLGHLYYDFKDFQTARGYWERMMEISGADVDIRVLTSLGNCHRKLKTYAQGVPYFKRALERDPRNFYALYGLADCYRGMHMSEQSLECWHRILEADPANKVILTRAGDAYRNLGRLEEAERFYREALNVEFDLYAVMGLAGVKRQRGHYDSAIQALEELINNDPGNVRAFLELSACYEEQRRYPEALAVLARFAQRGYPNRTIQRKIAELRARLG